MTDEDAAKVIYGTNSPTAEQVKNASKLLFSIRFGGGVNMAEFKVEGVETGSTRMVIGADLEECEWVVNAILKRNPQFFTDERITHAQRLQMMIPIFCSQRGGIEVPDVSKLQAALKEAQRVASFIDNPQTVEARYWKNQGESVWYEDGKVEHAPQVDGEVYADHGYVRDGASACAHGCGCWMGDSRSGGPVDPFGPCPNHRRAPEPGDTDG